MLTGKTKMSYCAKHKDWSSSFLAETESSNFNKIPCLRKNSGELSRMTPEVRLSHMLKNIHCHPGPIHANIYACTLTTHREIKG